jgi:hypothetical protein
MLIVVLGEATCVPGEGKTLTSPPTLWVAEGGRGVQAAATAERCADLPGAEELAEADEQAAASTASSAIAASRSAGRPGNCRAPTRRERPACPTRGEVVAAPAARD